jgi:hypothetical protein
MGRPVAIVLYVVAMATVIVGADLVFFRNRFWERLTVNIGIFLVFAAFYCAFESSTTKCHQTRLAGATVCPGVCGRITIGNDFAVPSLLSNPIARGISALCQNANQLIPDGVGFTLGTFTTLGRRQVLVGVSIVKRVADACNLMLSFRRKFRAENCEKHYLVRSFRKSERFLIIDR